MKSRTLAIALAVSTALALSGCSQVKKILGGGKPSGQVVATVDGDEITTLQLRAELGGFGSRDPEVMKAAQQQALQRIILRKILAKEARKQKLDKTTDYTLQVERGQETLLAQLYERKLASTLTQPTRQEAEAYVAAHPERFANRQLLTLSQVIAAPNSIPPAEFRPLKTLDEVKALLASQNVKYQENSVVLDTLSADSRLLASLAKLPPGEVFVINQGGAMVFNHVDSTRTAPFTGDMTTAFAMNALRNQRASQSVAKKISDMRKAAESKITYNPAYKPPPPKAAAPAPAAAPPATTAPAAPATK